MVILVVTVAVDLLLHQMNLETPMLANTLTAIEFLAVGLLVWVFVSHRRRQRHQPKTGSVKSEAHTYSNQSLGLIVNLICLYIQKYMCVFGVRFG